MSKSALFTLASSLAELVRQNPELADAERAAVYRLLSRTRLRLRLPAAPASSFLQRRYRAVPANWLDLDDDYDYDRSDYHYWPETGWDVPSNLSYEGWLAIGDLLPLRGYCGDWAKGEWWNLGESWDREFAAQSHPKTWWAKNLRWVRQCGSVARMFPPGARSEVLHFLHYEAVMPLAEKVDLTAAKELLDRASARRWDGATLRRQITRQMRREVGCVSTRGV